MYGFWYDYMKPKEKEKAKLCYVDKDSFIIYIKTEDVYVDITKDVERRFDIQQRAKIKITININVS